MKRFSRFLIFVVVLLSGCTGKTTVHVYAKYLTNYQTGEIKNTFERSRKYRVQLNEFDFPTGMADNTLLYSLLLPEPEVIDIAFDLSALAGFPIQHVHGLTQGNHWYSKDSIALFLFPQNRDSKQVFFQQDLVNEYRGQKCDKATSLKLNENGSFTLQKRTKSNGIDSVDGIWKYRHYPFLELREKDSAYADYFFEIKQFRGADKVSEIDFVELVSLNSGSLPEGCSFLVGTRL